MNKQDEEIIELNSTVKCKLGPSKIHGVGVIAVQDIQKGDRLYCSSIEERFKKFYSIPWGSRNKLFPEVRDLITDRWASWVNGSKFTHPHTDAWLILYMNHSEDYNYEPSTDCAIKDIPINTEILENYCRMENATRVYSWLRCDSKNDIIKE